MQKFFQEVELEELRRVSRPDLFEKVEVAAHKSKTHFARSMRIAAVKYEGIFNHIVLWNITIKLVREKRNSKFKI